MLKALKNKYLSIYYLLVLPAVVFGQRYNLPLKTRFTMPSPYFIEWSYKVDSIINYKDKKWYNRIFNLTIKNINLNEDKFSLFGIQNLNNSHIVNLEKYIINNEFKEEEISEKTDNIYLSCL